MRIHITLSNPEVLSKFEELSEHYSISSKTLLMEHVIIQEWMKVFKPEIKSTIDTNPFLGSSIVQEEKPEHFDDDRCFQ